MSLRRTAAIVRKEILHITRDPRNLFLVTVSPALLLFLLSYIFSFEATQTSLAVLDLDHSSLSRQYLASLTNDRDFVLAYIVPGYKQILSLLQSGEVDAALVIPPGFADTVNGGQPAQVQAVVDGTDTFGSRQAVGSLEARSAAFVSGSGDARQGEGSGLGGVCSLAWYNAGLESLHSMVPGLLAIVLIMPTMAFSLALARERETGTLEGLIVTPISGREYLLGKLLAYILAGLVSALLGLLLAVLWFNVPFRGSLVVYLLLASVYFLACMGAAMVIVSFVRSQQTAMFIIVIVFVVPSFFLAGLITPISTQSLGSMLSSYTMPATHFVEISRVVFLKGLGLPYLAEPTLILLGMGIAAVTVGLRLFRKKLT